MEKFSQNGFEFERWKIGASTFTACMTRGARLMRWELALPSGTREVIFWPDDADMDDIANVRGGNPILFPFMGRNYANGEKFFWNSPDGKKRPMPQHGWARQGNFEIVKSGTDFVETRFLPDEKSREGYPFSCDFFVRYKFRELGLECELALTNNDVVDIPWCAGHHFYFGLPWHKNLSREDYLVDVPARKMWRHSADGKLVRVPLISMPVSFAHPEISDLIYSRLRNNIVIFGPKNGEENVVLKVGEEPLPGAWTSVVTWTASDESPFYCVEPWMGPPNSHEHKNGLHWVAPNQTETFLVKIALD